MQIKKPQLVIFDMDGTMLDTEMLAIKGWEKAVAEQVPSVPHEFFLKVFNSMIGHNYESCKKIALSHMPDFDFDRGNEHVRKFKDEYFAEKGVPVKPGLIELLNKLEALGIKKNVATSTATDRATYKLGLANIVHRFDNIIGGDQVEASKPAPDIFLKAASVSNTAPENCLVLEDSAAGAEGGYRAGMQVIVVPDLLPPSEATRNMAALVCKDMFEVAAVIPSAL